MPIRPSRARSAMAILGRSRLPIDRLIEREQARIARLDARIGELMSQRVDREEVMADLIATKTKIEKKD